MLFQTDEKQQIYLITVKNQLKEVRNNGVKQVANHTLRKITEAKIQNNRITFKVEYFMGECQLIMIDKESKPFLEVKLVQMDVS